MHYRLVSLLLFIIISVPAIAQQPPEILYRQGAKLFWSIQDSADLQMAFRPIEGENLEVARVRWQIKGQEITVTSPQITTDSSRNFEVALFTLPLLDAAIDGHLAWGKAVLEQLDSQTVDSLVLVQTFLSLSEDSTVIGALLISFQGGWKVDDEFWNRAAQYKLLNQQGWVHDSVKVHQRTTARTQALLSLSRRSLTQSTANIKALRADLATSCQDTMLIDSLMQVEVALNEGLKKIKEGKAVTNTEKMRLAEQTTARSQLIDLINSQKNASCQKSLQQFLKVQRNRKNILRQNTLLEQQLLSQQKQLQSFQELYEETAQQLIIITARLPK